MALMIIFTYYELAGRGGGKGVLSFQLKVHLILKFVHMEKCSNRLQPSLKSADFISIV